MKKKIAILGSTGSIGKSTFEILKKDKNNFDIILLTTNNNYKEILLQTKVFKVKNNQIEIDIGFNTIIEQQPYAYQIINNKKKTVDNFLWD